MPWWGWIVGWAVLMVMFLWGLHRGMHIQIVDEEE